MNSKLPPQGPDNPISDADERALDALLGEMLKLNPPPPDLTAAILKGLSAQWEMSARGQVSGGNTAANKNGALVRLNGSGTSSAKRSRQSRLAWVSISAALAASALFVIPRLVDNAPDQAVAKHQPKPAPAAVSTTRPKPIAVISNEAVATAESTPNQALAATELPPMAPAVVVPREGVPLVRRDQGTSETAESPTVIPQPSEAIASASPSNVDLRLALKSFDAAMADYWKRVGVEPAAPIDAAQLAERVKARFGSNYTTAPEEPVVNAVLVTEDECRVFSTKLVASLFRNASLVDEAREKMIEQATATIFEGKRFDQLLSRWITDDSLFVRSQPEQLAQAVSTNLLDIDAACAKCHDSPIDGRYAQHDFWAFASVFAPADRPVLFYELPDGRQKASELHLPMRWLGVRSEEGAEAASPSLGVFANALLNNSTLAAALTNRVWEIGFEAPLVARSSALVSPPRDEALLKAHQELTEVLVKSNFDLRQLTRVIVSSDAMKRGSSELFAGDRWVVANESTLAANFFAERTFAAARSAQARLNRDQLVTAIESRLGGTLRAIDNPKTLLAQPSVEGSGAGQGIKSDKSTPEDFAWATWVADRGLLKDSWLHWIDDSAERERHAFYANAQMNASGASELSKRLMSPEDEPSNASSNAIDRLAWLLGQ
jgi:hypothetical protein